MTLKLTDGINLYNLAFNLQNVTGSWTLSLRSQLSHTNIIDEAAMTTVSTGDRYTEFSFIIPDGLPEEHKNGIYEYTITNGTDSETGLLKLITGSGGTTGTQAYVSNNEDREATVYFRPNY